ncbi:MAG: hypothetical protein ACTSU7_15100 [Candidatus Heimdallarchaeaceae archaeon]
MSNNNKEVSIFKIIILLSIGIACIIWIAPLIIASIELLLCFLGPLAALIPGLVGVLGILILIICGLVKLIKGLLRLIKGVFTNG